MRPLIPKVRLGDVLYGTRHLRRYLQAASVLTQISVLAEQGRSANLKKLHPLHVPRRNDEFITAVNADNRFGVWSRNGDIVLLFVNPWKCEDFQPPRMNPTIFSQWFIRTSRRKIDIAEWPLYALGLRLCFQYNLISWGKRTNQMVLNYVTCHDYNGPLVIGQLNKSWSPANLDDQNDLLRRSAEQGATRSKAFEAKLSTLQGGNFTGFGPLISDLKVIEAEIRIRYKTCISRGILKTSKSGEIDFAKPEINSEEGGNSILKWLNKVFITSNKP